MCDLIYEGMSANIPGATDYGGSRSWISYILHRLLDGFERGHNMRQHLAARGDSRRGGEPGVVFSIPLSRFKGLLIPQLLLRDSPVVVQQLLVGGSAGCTRRLVRRTLARDRAAAGTFGLLRQRRSSSQPSFPQKGSLFSGFEDVFLADQAYLLHKSGEIMRRQPLGLQGVAALLHHPGETRTPSSSSTF